MQAFHQKSIHNRGFAAPLKKLQQQLLWFAFFNLLLVSLVGLFLRSYPLFPALPLAYKNVLHGHSHFAFGGWLMPALLALFLKACPHLVSQVAYRHWRNIVVLLLVSAYGMLAAFPFQGYKAVSISFSTLSIFAGLYWAVVVWKALKHMQLTTAYRFFAWGLIYNVASAAGPFATGPLIVLGKQGTPLYFDVIYFFLHFQYNGFFSFFVLGLVYKMWEQQGRGYNGYRVFTLFNMACLPTYLLSVLWNQPPAVFNVVGGAGALLQLAGLYFLLKDVKRAKWQRNWSHFLLALSLFALSVKIALQLVSAVPAVALMAQQQRSSVIAYLHLVLLGFLSVFIFSQAIVAAARKKQFKIGVVCFLVAFVITEAVLALHAFSIVFSAYFQVLFAFSCLFPTGFFFMLRSLRPLKPAPNTEKDELKTSRVPAHVISAR